MREGVAAIRRSVALTDRAHVTHLRVAGENALAAVERICPAEILLRDGQLLHSLLLDEQAHPIADLYVARDDDSFILIAEGLAFHELAARLPGVELTPLDEEYQALGLDGPFAWELLGELVGPEVIGLPFGNLFHVDGWICFRAGKTGEYGYQLLIPRAEAPSVRARLEELGRRYHLGHAGLEALDHCALENWFFNPRREGRGDVTPIELQLQWRVSYRKEYVGASALRDRRAAGVRRRLTALAGPREIAIGDALTREGAPVGEIVNAGFCQPRGEWLALALVDLAWAHSGVDGFGAELRAISPPALANRSLYVNPQRHSYFDPAESDLMVIA